MATSNRHTASLFLVLAFAVVVVESAAGDDWPNYRKDNQRSAVTSESLSFPLSPAWNYQPQHGPRRAWPRNFRENPWTQTKIRTLLKFDHAFHPVVAQGAVYFGSSADHKVYCLDGATGQSRWDFFTEGPVRCAPTVWNGKVYVGSDDGLLYCLEAMSGALVWKVRVGPTDERLPGNEQLISRWPIRSGVAIVDRVAYCAAGLFPHREGCFLSAVDAELGKPLWTERIEQVSQGYLLASQTRLCVPAGKMAPRIYDRATGKLLAHVDSPAGTFALISDDVLYAGPGLSGGEMGAVETAHSNERLASFPGNQLIVSSESLFLLTDDKLRSVRRLPFIQKRLDGMRDKAQAVLAANPDGPEAAAQERKLREIEDRIEHFKVFQDKTQEWERACDCPHAMVLAGDTLLLGGDNKVRAVSAATGETVWEAEIDGQALGLVVANGMLLVSTDRGEIACFTADGKASSRLAARKIAAQTSPPERLVLAEATAKVATILDNAPSKKGYCLLLSSDRGNLAAEIANRSELTVVQIESKPDAADALRRVLDQKRLYGPRVVVHGPGESPLPYPKYLFNLIVIDRSNQRDDLPAADEVARLLRPFGAAVVFAPHDQPQGGEQATLQAWVEKTGFSDTSLTSQAAWALAVLRRGKLAGSGDWTHQYADPGHTACSDDRLIKRPLRLQWFGRPGPYHMFDRHAYTTSPVYSRGHVYTLGEKILYGNDAYNGTVLWSVELPDLATRVNLPRDCGFMAADETGVFVAAQDKCLRIDGDTGQRLPACTLPITQSEFDYDWGYVALQEDLLFGSGVRHGSFFDDGRGPWYDDSDLSQPEYSLKVLSDFLFATSKDGQTLAWRYDGVIINSTITLGGGRVYFIENRHPDVLKSASRRLAGGEAWMDLYLVALNASSGERLWEKQLEYKQRTPVFFLGYKHETIVITRSPGEFQLTAIDASSGKHRWEERHAWEQSHHGGHRRHPVIMDDVVYQQPHAYDLKTGKKKWSTDRFGGNCGTLSACNSMMFSRLSNFPGLIDLRDGASTENLVEVTRPGCWINIIPAGGMILVPEAGSGCSCTYPMHASMAFLSP